MQINLKNHRANIFEKNPYDEKKVSIVFVPGAGMDHRIISMFDLEALYEEYNILGIDLPGHGYTSGPIVDSIRDHTNFCIDVFKEINIKKPIVVIGGINNINYKKLVNTGAKYIALSSFIWDNPKLKPEQAIKKFK